MPVHREEVFAFNMHELDQKLSGQSMIGCDSLEFSVLMGVSWVNLRILMVSLVHHINALSTGVTHGIPSDVQLEVLKINDQRHII